MDFSRQKITIPSVVLTALVVGVLVAITLTRSDTLTNSDAPNADHAHAKVAASSSATLPDNAQAEWDSLALNDIARDVLGERYMVTEIVGHSLVVHCYQCDEADFDEIQSRWTHSSTQISWHEVELTVDFLRASADEIVNEFYNLGISHSGIYADVKSSRVVVGLTPESMAKAQEHPSLNQLMNQAHVVVEEVDYEIIGYNAAASNQPTA